MREYKDPRVLIRFEPSVPGISRAHIEVVNSRHVFCELTARNIQRALALPEDGEIVQVEMILRRVDVEGSASYLALERDEGGGSVDGNLD